MIKIIDYKAGNAPSVLNAVNKLGFYAELCKEPKMIGGASYIILPGVGSAGATMRSLIDEGFLPVLNEAVLNKKIPYLGICVGMQIVFEHSEEDDIACLGWLKGNVVRFDNKKVRVPQMGWNKVSFNDGSPSGFYYFVNSYHAIAQDKTDLLGVADYGGSFTAAIKKGNISGTQFHIEKSGEAGLNLLRGFLQC